MRRKEKFYTEEQKEIFRFGKILFGLIIIIGLLYLFTSYVVNKEDTYKRTNNDGKVQYESIILGTLLNRSDDEYYVLAYDGEITFNQLYVQKINDYKTKTNHLPIYKADLSNELNKTYVAEESSYNSDSIEGLKVKGTTLIKVKKGKIVKFIENKDEILNTLN